MVIVKLIPQSYVLLTDLQIFSTKNFNIHQGVEKDMIYLHSSQSAEFFCNDIGNETDVFRAIKLLYFHTFPIFARQS